MATTSATSSIVASLGAGSGIDFAGLAENLATAQFAARRDRNVTRAETVDRQISAASTLKNSLLQLSSSIADRVRSGDLSRQPVIANPAAAAVSRGSGSGSGSYALEVTRLATQQILASPPIASATTPAGTGSLTFRFGTVAGSTFAEDATHPPATVTIASSATLADVAKAINTAGIGISAYVANGTDGARLMLKGQDGTTNGFTLEATETPGAEGLAALAWTPAAAPERLLGVAQDAAFKLDGLAMTRPSNSIAGLVPGLDLTLTGTNTGAPTTIGFSDPATAVSGFMSDLVSALNEIAAELNTQTNPLSGELARDGGARAMRQGLSQLAGTIVIPGAVAGEPATLADLGLAITRDGTFRLDSERLAATQKASPSGVAAMFTTGLYGIHASFDKLARKLTSAGDTGSLSGSIARLTARKAELAKESTRLTEAQEASRARLATRFAGTEGRVSASKSTLSFLQNQIAMWTSKGD